MSKPSVLACREAAAQSNEAEAPLLSVADLRVWFPITSGILRRTVGWIRAVDGLDLQINKGETLALVGESGSGKSTVARAIMRLVDPQSGSIRLDGVDLLALNREELRRIRPKFQMVFQDSYSSLDPRQTVGSIVHEAIAAAGRTPSALAHQRAKELLEVVHLGPQTLNAYPHELSGGQRQRIGIARALAMEPDLIVCDEPISALDVSIQAQIVNLLEDLQSEFSLTYLVIAHNLAVVRHMAHQVAVMYLGKLVEVGRSDQLYRNPRHPYTAALLSAIPIPSVEAEHARERIILPGDVPSPAAVPSGCRFHPRCWLREALGRPEICTTAETTLTGSHATDSSHSVACHFAAELDRFRGVGPRVPEQSA